ncbi:MAG: 50S ribosomal protein L25 [Bryobacteraceae bacterium]|jgi:large subunit ribosomal protein L25
MRKELTIAAEPRSSRGKNEARRLRVAKLIPAVVYGAGKAPVPVSVSPKDIVKILNSGAGGNTIFDLNITGQENTPVMLKDWQNHPLKENLLHVDFIRIDLSQRLRLRVRVLTIGDPRGVKEQGGVYETITRDIEIECLPDEIPENFKIDVTEFLLGSSLRAGDVKLSGSMKLLSSPDQVISHVIAPAKVVEEEAALVEGAAVATTPGAAEPEVIKKGKKEEEGKEAEKGAKGEKAEKGEKPAKSEKGEKKK